MQGYQTFAHKQSISFNSLYKSNLNQNGTEPTSLQPCSYAVILYSVIYFQHYIRVLMYIKISILIVQAGPAHTGLN